MVTVMYIHEMYHFNHFEVYSSVAVSTFILSYSHYHHASPELVIFPNRYSIPTGSHPPPSSRQPPFYFLNLMTLGNSHKRNHTVLVLLWLAYVTLA